MNRSQIKIYKDGLFVGAVFGALATAVFMIGILLWASGA